MNHVAGMKVVETLSDIGQLTGASRHWTAQQRNHAQDSVCLHLDDSQYIPRGARQASDPKHIGGDQWLRPEGGQFFDDSSVSTPQPIGGKPVGFVNTRTVGNTAPKEYLLSLLLILVGADPYTFDS